MPQSKQNTQVAIRLYAYNGGFRAFEQVAIAYDVWNAQFMFEADYQDSPTVQSLTGFERGGIQGYRAMCSIDLKATYGTNATKVRQLLNWMSETGVGSRRMLTTTFSYVDDNIIVLTEAPNALANDFYKGFEVNQGDTEKYIITAYNGTTKQATLSGDPTFAEETGGTPNDINVRVPNSMNVIARISPTTDIGDGEYYNLVDSVYGVQRELTIGSQIISLNFRGVERKDSISDTVRIGTA
jgi:hypothetical protein